MTRRTLLKHGTLAAAGAAGAGSLVARSAVAEPTLIERNKAIVGRWFGGGTHTGPAFSDFLAGSLPAATGRKMHFTGTTVIKVVNGKITEEIGLDDGVTALTQLGLLRRT